MIGMPNVRAINEAVKQLAQGIDLVYGSSG
jgi:hypothetical protein